MFLLIYQIVLLKSYVLVTIKTKIKGRINQFHPAICLRWIQFEFTFSFNKYFGIKNLKIASKKMCQVIMCLDVELELTIVAIP